jgi:hypothetical protein
MFVTEGKLYDKNLPFQAHAGFDPVIVIKCAISEMFEDEGEDIVFQTTEAQ